MSKDASSSGEQPLIAHLLELRTRLLRALIGVLIVFIPLAYFAKDFYRIVAAPLMQLMPAGTGMIATEVASPFFAPFKLAGLAALVIALPWVLYQIWAFIAPGLYKNERGAFAPFLALSPLLFGIGVAFVYYFVLPMVMRFSLGQEQVPELAGTRIELLLNVSDYMNLITTLMLVFGISFQMPVFLMLLAKAGILRAQTLLKGWRFAVVGIALFAAFATPPDPISQILLGGALLLLYFVSIGAMHLMEPKERGEDEDASSS